MKFSELKGLASNTALDTKVDKVAGKGLSTEDYTTAEKTKLQDISMTKAGVGLGNVDNTADSAKPISTAAQTAFNTKAPLTGVGTSGFWPISVTGSASTVPWAGVSDKPALLTIGTTSTTAKAGNYAPTAAEVVGLTSLLDGKVSVVAGKQLSTEDFSTAEKSKLSGIAPGAQANVTPAVADVTGLVAALAAKANLAAPAFTGVPTAPTAALGTNTTQLATMAAVKAATDIKQATLSVATTLEMQTGTLNALKGMTPLGVSQAIRAKRTPRVVIVGDSLMSQEPTINLGVGYMLEAWIKSATPVEVINLSMAGLTFYQAGMTPFFGTKTVLQKVIDLAPDVVVVSLGMNDHMSNIDGSRTVVQIKVDALDFFTYLRSALPSAKIIFGGQNIAHAPVAVATLINDQIIPAHQTTATSGLLHGVYCQDILSQPVSADTKTKIGNTRDLNIYVNGLASITSSFSMDVFAMHRVGVSSPDRLHMRPIGHAMMAGFIAEHFLATNVFPELRALNWGVGQVNIMIGSFFTDPYNNGLLHFIATHGNNILPLTSWFMGYAHIVSYVDTIRKSNTLANPSTPFYFVLTDFPPYTNVEASVNNGAWVNFGRTSGTGNLTVIKNGSDVGAFGFVTGANTIRFRSLSTIGTIGTVNYPVIVTE